MQLLAVAALGAMLGGGSGSHPAPGWLTQSLSLHISLDDALVPRRADLKAALHAPLILYPAPRVEIGLGKLMKAVGAGAHYRIATGLRLGAGTNLVKPIPGAPLALQVLAVLQLRF